jgi:photosystem II stability/assembly factor-like uncharacterized protein
MKTLFVFFFTLVTSFTFAQQQPQEGKDGWYQLNIGTQDDRLRRVQFFSRSHGWVCGDINAYHTTDGGEHWVTFVAPALYHYFYFLNDSTGFANGTTPDEKHMMIMKTTDRGQTWSEPFQYGGINPHRDMTHIGDTIWLINSLGGEGIRSTDGGKSWTEFTTGVSFQKSISFVDSKHGYIVGEKTGFPNYAGFAYTPDGKNWFAKSSGINVDLHGVFAISENKVFAVGDFETIYLTTNTGVSWDSLPHQPNINVYYDITFSDSLNGCIVGAPGIIRRTTDGGATWIAQKSTIEYPQDTSALIYLWDVCFVDSLYGWTVGWTSKSVGMGNVILKTITGGFISAGIVEKDPTFIPTQIFPEPNIGITRIKYYLPEAQNTTITLYSMNGQIVKSLVNGYQPSGENEILMDLHDLPSGIYQYELGSERFSSTGQLSIVK